MENFSYGVKTQVLALDYCGALQNITINSAWFPMSITCSRARSALIHHARCCISMKSGAYAH